MKKVITYGTFDLFHEGHKNILKRSKELGDYLIVGVTAEEYDINRGKLNVKQTLLERIENVKKSGYADEVIIEYREGQKISDIKKYSPDIFAIGSDWLGKFDYLKEYCNVTYLERTPHVSSTQLRNKNNGVLNIGIIGTGRIANRFLIESKYVSGVNIAGVCSKTSENAKKFQEKYELDFWTTSFNELLEKVDAVYIASPHETHYTFSKKSLLNGKHVLCEKPATLSFEEMKELLELSKNGDCIFLEGIKTLYAPGFVRLIEIAKSGIIGDIIDVDASFTKLVSGDTRELDKNQKGGSFYELGSYVIAGILKLLGEPKEVDFFSYKNEDGLDLYTKIFFQYKNKVATGSVGLGVKKEGEMVISGTKGYIYVPAPWWLTQEFEVRFEDLNLTKKYFYEFQGDGLRYEIAEFLNLILTKKKESWKYSHEEILNVSKIISLFK